MQKALAVASSLHSFPSSHSVSLTLSFPLYAPFSSFLPISCKYGGKVRFYLGKIFKPWDFFFPSRKVQFPRSLHGCQILLFLLLLLLLLLVFLFSFSLCFFHFLLTFFSLSLLMVLESMCNIAKFVCVILCLLLQFHHLLLLETLFFISGKFRIPSNLFL